MIFEQKIKRTEIGHDNRNHESIQDEFKSQIAKYYSYLDFEGKARESSSGIKFKPAFSL